MNSSSIISVCPCASSAVRCVPFLLWNAETRGGNAEGAGWFRYLYVPLCYLCDTPRPFFSYG